VNKEDIVIIWLSIQISLLSFLLVRAEKRASYLEGQQQGQTVTINEPDTDGTYPGYHWTENVPTDKKKKLHKS